MFAKPTVVLTLVMLVACATGGKEPASTILNGKRWQLVELRGSPSLAGDTPRAPHLLFESDSARVGGATGCNHLSGTFDASGDSLRFGPLITTKMACADTLVMRQEFDFVTALDSTRRYAVSGDTLTLLGERGVLARFIGSTP